MQNSANPQLSPTVNVSSTVTSPGPLNSPGVISAMTTPGRDVKLTSPKQDPLLIVRARFWERKIAQEMPLGHASNALTITIIPTFHVTSGSNVTLTGLSGTLSADTDCLLISGLPHGCLSHEPSVAVNLPSECARISSEEKHLTYVVALCVVLKQDCQESFCTVDYPASHCQVNCRC